MKVGIKLHHHQRSKGPIDTYQMKRSPYSADYRLGCKILQSIRHYNQRPSQTCLVHLATFVTRSWEKDLNADKVHDIQQFMNHLLDTTGINDQTSNLSLDESIQLYCSRETSVPTVCPGLTLLFAVRYIERLKQNYGNIKGTNGCSRRLVLVAYIMAAKYIHSNLKFIIDTNVPTLKNMATSSLSTNQQQQQQEQEQKIPTPLPSVALPVSPPLSPLSSKQAELTDPTQYHYFHPARTTLKPHKEKPPNTSHYSQHTLPSGQSDSLPSFSSMYSHFNYRIWRMENEFLHFLNEDIDVPDCLGLAEWAKQVGGGGSSSPLV
ncbi:hypothetical protein BC941DRAFT_469525 [Chlamydoabsidia padenii]|nr:hypothetical protein BC941DRAFT_469525 [Chlamydoabsidia padenii]